MLTGTLVPPIKMYLSPKIKYVGLDFDNVICELSNPFVMLWTITHTLDRAGVLDKAKFLPLWIKELEEQQSTCKVTVLNPECLMLLKHIAHMPEHSRPTVFLYTNNTYAEIIQCIHQWIELCLRRTPWAPTLVFHPQDHRRTLERPLLAPDEPGKSFDGMRACMNFPPDFLPETVLFVDDKLHTPALRDLGPNYIHHDPPYVCKDQMRPYVVAYFRAIRKLQLSEDATFLFRSRFRDLITRYAATRTDYFYAHIDMYSQWDCKNTEEFEDLFLDTPREILDRLRETRFRLYDAVKDYFPMNT